MRENLLGDLESRGMEALDSFVGKIDVWIWKFFNFTIIWHTECVRGRRSEA